MRIVLYITRKELVVYFKSPMAYVVAAVFLALMGVFFIDSIEGAFAEAAIRGLLVNAVFFLMPLMPPILTMRLFAEEQKLGTLELLLTAPVRDYEVVLAKFLASFVILVSILLFTLFYLAILFYYSNPDPGPVFSGYLGFILYGAAALAIGLLASSLTSNQIVAATVGFGIVFLFTILDRISGVLEGPVSTALGQMSLPAHFESFARGVIDTSDVVYFIVLTAVFLFLTVRAVESRRWR